MRDRATRDPGVVIEKQGRGRVRYRRLGDGRRWEVLGECAWTDPDRWGPCGEGADEPAPGGPAFRPDVPVTPELRCSLCVDGGHLRFREL